MGDVANNSGKHRPERAVLSGTMECGVARPRTDVQDLVADGEHVQPSDSVDVDQMRRMCEAEAMIGTRLWPPARTRPSCGANSASSRTASDKVSGRWYVNGAGFSVCAPDGRRAVRRFSVVF